MRDQTCNARPVRRAVPRARGIDVDVEAVLVVHPKNGLHEVRQRVIAITTRQDRGMHKTPCYTRAHFTSFEMYPRLILPLGGGPGGWNTCGGIQGWERAAYEVLKALRCGTRRICLGVTGYVNCNSTKQFISSTYAPENLVLTV